MPTNLCMSLTAISAWWGITITTIFCKLCTGEGEGEYENTCKNQDHNKNTRMFTIEDIEDIVETSHTEKTCKRPSIEIMERNSHPVTHEKYRNTEQIKSQSEDLDNLYEFI